MARKKIEAIRFLFLTVSDWYYRTTTRLTAVRVPLETFTK